MLQKKSSQIRKIGDPSLKTRLDVHDMNYLFYPPMHPFKQHLGGGVDLFSFFPINQGGAQDSQKFLETEEWPRWRLWWPSFGSEMDASEREGHWRLASLYFCKNSPSAFTFFFVKVKVFLSLSLSIYHNMCSSWKGSEGIESTRTICLVSTSEIKAGKEQFDHESRKCIWKI